MNERLAGSHLPASRADVPHQRWPLILLGWHLALILGVSCADIFHLIGGGPTILPRGVQGAARTAEAIFSAAIGWEARVWNPIRPQIRAYLHCAGIESGYSFFAPNVPQSYKVIFELRYADGRSEYDVLTGERAETNLRLASLLDLLGQTRSDALREVLMKLVAHSIWEFHPEATSIRAILGTLRFPTLGEFRAGREKSYEPLYTYDFSFGEAATP